MFLIVRCSDNLLWRRNEIKSQAALQDMILLGACDSSKWIAVWAGSRLY